MVAGINTSADGNNSDPEGNNQVMARPEFQVTEKAKKMVTDMAGFGFRHDDIATMLEITPKTLRKHFRSELDRGAIEANQKVMKSLFGMATSGKNTSASIFWAKTRCGMRERGPERETTAATDVPKLTVELA
ncbi:MAG TPA: hypothetical protein VH351_22965 [Bryobacteraceae bacterium]|nr:hypothetical protein [Bryobacteraceae bacterium]